MDVLLQCAREVGDGTGVHGLLHNMLMGEC